MYSDMYTSVGSYGMTTKNSSLNIHIHADVQWHVHECGILRNDNKRIVVWTYTSTLMYSDMYMSVESYNHVIICTSLISK